MNYYFLFYRDTLLLTPDHRIPEAETCPVQPAEGHALHHLPDLDGRGCYTAEADAPVPDEGWTGIDLRASFDLLPHPLYQMAGKAHEILHWDRTTRFCGICGAPMKLHTDISKRCTHCGQEVWPTPAAAIIVAVTRNHGEEILLVQSNRFKKDYMGLVAGFVETGESLEECLRREVMEETHISVKHVRYFASQPWPYPCGLMVGFTAEYDGGELCLQHSELNKGGWFNRQNLPAIPGKVSLARRLIDHWLYATAEEQGGDDSRQEL